MTRAHMHGRLQRIEDVVDVALRPQATREEAQAWTRRFIAADPRYAEIIKKIDEWGRTHRIDWIGPWREVGAVHAGEYLLATHQHTWWQLRRRPGDREEPEKRMAAPMLLELAPLLAEYQRRTNDIFPLDWPEWFVRELCHEEFLQSRLAMAHELIARTEQGSQQPCA